MNQHSEQSSYREKLVEHLFVSELLRISWQSRNCELEVAKPEVDNAGYDLIAEAGGIIRHIQLKASYLGSRTSKQKVHQMLSEKPAGCVVWIYFDSETLELGPFLYFGSDNRGPLPDISDLPVARHTKGNREGYKAARPNIRVVNKGRFAVCKSPLEIYEALFGPNA